MNDLIPPARVWLITGCSSGLGLALATKLLERGQRVIATTRRPESLDHLVAHWTWRIRGAIDRICGGLGLRRGRRDADDIRVGEALDFWRVRGHRTGASAAPARRDESARKSVVAI